MQQVKAQNISSGYEVEQSLLFKDSNASHLSRNFTGSPTLSTKATTSLWWKRAKIGDTGVDGGEQTLISWGTGSGNRAFLRSKGGQDKLEFGIINGSGSHLVIITPVLRDFALKYTLTNVS